MVINHLVLSGGVVGLVEYGILKQLSKSNIINYNNIKSMLHLFELYWFNLFIEL